MSHVLSEEIIRTQLRPAHQSQLATISLHDTLSSTNDALWQQLDNGLDHPAACLANQQSAGRGSRGDTWQSPASGNLYLSFYYPLPQTQALHGISLLAGVALVDALTLHGVTGLQLKWPNDLFYQQKKLGGILVESRVGKQQHLVIGIGVNHQLSATQQTQISQAATSLAAIHPAPPCRNILAGSLLDQLLLRLNTFESEGLAPIIAAWQQHDACYQQPIFISDGKQKIVAFGKGVDAEGYFQYQLSNSEQQCRILIGQQHIRLT